MAPGHLAGAARRPVAAPLSILRLEELIEEIESLEKPASLTKMGDQQEYPQTEEVPHQRISLWLEEACALEELGVDLSESSNLTGCEWMETLVLASMLSPARLPRIISKNHGLMIECIGAMRRIGKIALAAYHSGAAIRWFQYDCCSSSGGNPDMLVPLNAREIASVPARGLSALTYLALTTSNRFALVFLAPGNGTRPPVLFTSDSLLDFSTPIPWSDGMVITAPHHGAEANKAAYDRFAKETGGSVNPTWVRSDGRFRSRPGPSYRQVLGQRYCTLCWQSSHPKQDVLLGVVNGRWAAAPGVRPCAC